MPIGDIGVGIIGSFLLSRTFDLLWCAEEATFPEKGIGRYWLKIGDAFDRSSCVVWLK